MFARQRSRERHSSGILVNCLWGSGLCLITPCTNHVRYLYNSGNLFLAHGQFPFRVGGYHCAPRPDVSWQEHSVQCFSNRESCSFWQVETQKRRTVRNAWRGCIIIFFRGGGGCNFKRQPTEIDRHMFSHYEAVSCLICFPRLNLVNAMIADATLFLVTASFQGFPVNRVLANQRVDLKRNSFETAASLWIVTPVLL